MGDRNSGGMERIINGGARFGITVSKDQLNQIATFGLRSTMCITTRYIMVMLTVGKIGLGQARRVSLKSSEGIGRGRSGRSSQCLITAKSGIHSGSASHTGKLKFVL